MLLQDFNIQNATAAFQHSKCYCSISTYKNASTAFQHKKCYCSISTFKMLLQHFNIQNATAAFQHTKMLVQHFNIKNATAGFQHTKMLGQHFNILMQVPHNFNLHQWPVQQPVPPLSWQPHSDCTWSNHLSRSYVVSIAPDTPSKSHACTENMKTINSKLLLGVSAVPVYTSTIFMFSRNQTKYLFCKTGLNKHAYCVILSACLACSVP